MPVYINSALANNPIDSVFIFTAFSSRTDSSDSIDYHKHAMLEAQVHLEERGYAVSCANPADLNDSTLVLNGTTMCLQLDWIDSYGLNDRGYVMVLELTEADSGWVLTSYIEVKVHGYLFDTRSKTLVWQDEGHGGVSEYPGGLPAALNPIKLERAVELAVQNLMMSFPMHGKRFRSL